MKVTLHPHALARLAERGVVEQEVILAVEAGERFEAKFGRVGFRRNVAFKKRWRGKRYKVKQIEAYAVRRYGGWLVISVVARYF